MNTAPRKEMPQLSLGASLTKEFLTLYAIRDSTTRESLQRVIEHARTEMLKHGRNLPKDMASTEELTGPILDDLKKVTTSNPSELYALIADRVTDHIRRLGEMESKKAA